MVTSEKPAVKGYELLEPIGEGAYGIVYRARQPFVDREVALKVILPEFANQPAFIRRFETEAQLVAQLEHLHIVPLYDYWRDPQGAYLVMRLMKGGNLAELLLDGPVELTQAVKLVDQITSALQAAHQQSVVHRDLKPANILFDQAGNVYLSDFGIAKSIRAEGDLTATGAILGTPAYISPEQVQSRPVSPQTDIYALGILLFEILTGQHPFPLEASGSLLVKHVNDPLPLVHQVRPEIPHEVDQVIQRATAKDPASRYPDALTLARELRCALHFEIVLPEVMAGELLNPYKGLRAFQEADADDFFGREALVKDLIARLGEQGEYARFLAVVGPSGSGKSSVVKAGLIPALRQGGLSGSENWFNTELVPGSHPLEELELALLRVAVHQPPSLLGQIKEDPRGLIRATRRILPADAQLLLVVDQLEEAFTLVDNPEETDFFLQSLFEAIIDPRSPVRIIITLRADFYDRPLMHPDFSTLIQKRTEVVVPMTAEELQLAVRKPAERVGALLDKDLVPSIVSDVVNQPGALPLLQYALRELFEKRSGRMLTYQAYQSIGGVTGALGRRAEEIYSQLDDPSQEAARQLFLRLVSLGEGEEDTRRRVLRSEVQSLQAAELDRVIDVFGEARLLTFDHHPTNREPTLEVSHEALLKEWSRLQNWLDESRGDVRMQRLLANASAEWLDANQDPSFLLRGSRLAQFEEWMAGSTLVLIAGEKVFLEASLEAKNEREQAEKERRKRELEQVSIGLASQAIQELDGPHPERSVLLALEAMENYPYTWQAERALGKSVLENRLRLVLKLDNEINYAEWSCDGSNLLTSGKDGKIRIWDAHSGEELQCISRNAPIFARWSPDNESILAMNEQWHFNVLDTKTELPRFKLNINEIGEEINIQANDWYPWSPSGQYFLVCYANGQLIIYDAFTGEKVQSLSGHHGPVNQALWSPDGELVASSSIEDGQVIVWHVGTGEILHKFPGGYEDERVIFACWSPDGDRFATRGLGGVKVYDSDSGEQLLELSTLQVWNWRAIWSPVEKRLLTSGMEDGTARIWDTESGLERHRLIGLDHARGSSWSQDGKLVAVAGDDSIIHIWDFNKDREIQKFPGASVFTFLVSFSPDDKRLLTLGAGNSYLNVYDISEATLSISLPPPSGDISMVSWSPSGEQIANFSYENRLPNIWNASSGEKEMILEGHGDVAETITWSPAGDRILTTCYDNMVRIWNASTGENIQTLRGHNSELENGSWSPDGKLIVTADKGGEIIVWDSITGKEQLKFTGHNGKVFHVRWSPTDSRILSCDENGRAYIWDGISGKVIFRLFPDDFRVSLYAAGWMHASKRVMLQSTDRIVYVFDTVKGEKIREYTFHSWGYDISSSPDDNRLLNGGVDGTARVYQADSGEEVFVYDVGGGLVNAKYSPDGKQVLIGTYAGDLMIFPTWQTTQELIDYAKQHKVFRQLTDEERERFGLPPMK